MADFAEAGGAITSARVIPEKTGGLLTSGGMVTIVAVKRLSKGLRKGCSKCNKTNCSGCRLYGRGIKQIKKTGRR